MYSMILTLLVLLSTALVVSADLRNLDTNNIYVYVYIGDNLTKSFARAYGEITEVIPEEERTVWNLLEPQLKDTVNRYIGVWPDEVFIKKPLPQEYRNKTSSPWNQVTRTIRPVAFRAERLSKRTGLIKNTEEFTNMNNHSISYKPNLSTQTIQSVYCSWNISKQLKTRHEINYNVDFINGAKTPGARGDHEFSIKSDWGKYNTQTKLDTIGNDLDFQIELQAGQKIKSVISMTRGVLKVAITYNATLNGDMACYYKGHNPNIFSHDVNTLLGFSGFPTEITSREVITITYYTDVTITITDQRTNQVLYTNAKISNDNKDEEYIDEIED